ncbi:cell envelope integrity protein TolA [Phyllobacterium myrsinacearum]|nr:cell envelope integrity protein TolA [Phyllobacterium myrsinacearum]
MAAAPVHAEDNESANRSLAAIAEKIKFNIQTCWNRPDTGKDNVSTVTVRFTLDKDGTIIGAPEIVNPSKSKNFELIANSAIRAVTRCAPYSVVAENPALYDDLKEIILNFSSPEN